MQDYAPKAKAILTTYLVRGRQALAAFLAGEDDEGTRLLSLRTAAFHNFRVVDSLVERAGFSLAEDPKAQAIWREIQETDHLLKAALKDAQTRTAETVHRLAEARRAFQGYRSGVPESTQFAKTA